MKNNRIAYTKPSISDLEVKYATDAARNGWGTQCYDYIYKFETALRNLTGAKYAIATSSCTGAIHMGLSALGVKSGDEVILANTNWIATAAPIVHLGANPVFIDILSDTWCIDPARIEEAITPRTKAIIATHLYGNLCEMDVLNQISKKHNLHLIEDSAEALGSYYKDQHAGTLGAFGTFSFHGTKTLTTGEGGAFITNDPELYERVLTLSNHGRKRGQARQFWAEQIGFKYKMSNIEAALGCAQIERAGELIGKKRDVFHKYENILSELIQCNVISMNPEHEGTVNGYWMPTVVFAKDAAVSREDMQEAFEQADIDARVFFWPLSMLPVFDDVDKHTTPNSFDICARAMNLPGYADMSDHDIERVCNVIKDLAQKL
ncbi:MAG: DegT/DnrJ/EryC1/StrS family aminotransferase [Rhodospirillales bacterium]|nr:DegT/DnrJ/EryC1/StrS family aminotransferase [Alphaproteobacteria bacterium]USO06676.1 MAG: DegT/DnrJ/EryC1/StrS family aminotransferase [Rhodospirillales bacterium]HOO49717.1 DegT/DnrJ/EryC1/StrS family aminotransferase [Alphaproteobacteria bacterium]